MIRGSCLCGAVRYEVQGQFVESHHCHCSACRKTHGAAFATYACCAASELRVIGRENLTEYASSPAVKRAFCRACGSRLFFTHEGAVELVWITGGTLDEDDATERTPVPDAHAFVASKARWWTIRDELPVYDGQRPELGG